MTAIDPKFFVDTMRRVEEQLRRMKQEEQERRRRVSDIIRNPKEVDQETT